MVGSAGGGVGPAPCPTPCRRLPGPVCLEIRSPKRSGEAARPPRRLSSSRPAEGAIADEAKDAGPLRPVRRGGRGVALERMVWADVVRGWGGG